MSANSPLMEKEKKGSSPRSKFSRLIFVLGIVFVIFFAIGIWKIVTAPELTPVIQTVDGPIQGNIQYSRDGKAYWQFLSIPYAVPMVGELLFKPPVPVEPWEGVKQVTSYPSMCAQYDLLFTARTVGDMDCMFLNVYASAADGSLTEGKPVLVYIHGGGFLSGTAKMFRADYFMDHDVVVVVMNYRLGPYGFLNVKKEDGKGKAQGNMGLMDQNLVLKWVQRNIAAFGGDPGKVTLYGESAGAAAVHLQVLSPMSRGLFHKAIMHSGSALPLWAFSLFPQVIAQENAKKFGCSVKDSGDLLKCYENMDWKQVVKTQDSLLEPMNEMNLFQPSIDGTFLQGTPLEILKSGDFPPIPVMFGVNAAEGAIRSARFEAMPELIPELDKKWTTHLKNVLLYDHPIPTDYALKVKQQYFGNMKFADDPEGFKQNLTLYASDAGFFDPAHRSAIYHAKRRAPTYMFYYNYTSNVFPAFYSIFRAFRVDDWLPAELKLMWAISVDWLVEHIFRGSGGHKFGVGHGEDIMQLWNIEGICKWFSYFDADFSRSFVKSVVDFTNGTEPLNFRENSWPPINDELISSKNEYTIPYMVLDREEESKVIAEPFASRIKFLADLRKWN